MAVRVLIKIGGKAFEHRASFQELAAEINKRGDTQIIIVHGGGAEISQALKDAGRKTRFIDGIRVTEAEDIKIVENVLTGTVNARIAAWLEDGGVACRRLSGRTQRLFVVEPFRRREAAYGFVGKIKTVNAAVVENCLNRGRVPVVSPISADKHGHSYNVNADSAAAALAAGTQCTDLIFFTDVPGVHVDGSVCPHLTASEAKSLIAEGVIKGGMIAKLEAAFEAVTGKGVNVHIARWQGTDTLSRLLQGRSAAGTILSL